MSLKKIVKDLLDHYRQNSFVCYGELIEPEFVDETVFKLGTHGGRHDKDRSGWFPHYDIAYKCYTCRYYEHYTHYIEGNLLSMTVLNVIFDFTTDEFDIIENGETIPAGRLPDDIEYDSTEFQVYFRKILDKANS